MTSARGTSLPLALTALAFGMFAALVLPLQTYLGNAGDYAYSFARLAAEQSAAALCIAALAYIALSKAGETPRRLLAATLVALMVAAYIEAGPLASSLPEIDGELPKSLANAARKCWDGAFWLALLAAALATAKKTAPYLHFVALATLVMGSASLLDAKSGAEAAPDETRAGGYELSSDIIDNVEYSPTRNVMLFVLDNVDSFVAADIVEKDPALAARFSGFTAYRNNIGMHDSTKLGVPGMMTGEYFKPGRGALADYIMSVFGKGSFMQGFKDRGDAIYAMFCTSSYGYTTADIPQSRSRVKAQSSGLALFRRTAEVPYLSLFDAVAFRALPFAFKRQFLATKLRNRDTIRGVSETYDHESVVFPQLASRPVSADARQMFMKMHTHGGHPPFMFGATDYRSAVSNSLDRLAALFDALREKGVYGKSFIAVVADHGAEQVSREGEPFKCAAMLWMKPEATGAPFAVVDEPTSHSKIAGVMRAAGERSLSAAEVGAMLREENRFYRIRDRKDRHSCFDFTVDASRKARKK